VFLQVWGEELQTGPLPRTELGEAERASRQLEDQVKLKKTVLRNFLHAVLSGILCSLGAIFYVTPHQYMYLTEIWINAGMMGWCGTIKKKFIIIRD
jgi:hypothetical protein